MRAIGLVLLMLTAGPLFAQETVLRHDNYLAFMAAPGEEVVFDLKSMPREPYHADLRLLVLDPKSREVADHVVTLNTQDTLTYRAQTEGLHVLATGSGQCLATARRTNGPFALVAWEQTPLNVVRSFATHYFLVPRGMNKFEISISASVKGEGARLGIIGPDGKPVVEMEDDFDTLQRIKVDVPKGMDGQPWALTLTDPKGENLFFDDVLLWLGRGLPPYLCEQPEWLTGFVSSLQPEQISLQVPLKSVRFADGGTVTQEFTLEAVPQAKTIALRGVAQDVDYPNEGTVSINGSKPYMIPLTGDGASVLVTIPVKAADLKAGMNVLEFKHDNRGSSAMGLSELGLLAGEVIHEGEAW